MTAATRLAAADEQPGERAARALARPVPAATGRTNRLWRWYLFGFTLYWLIVTSNAVFPLLLLAGKADLSDADRAKLQLLLLPCLAMVPILIALRARGMASMLTRNPMLVVLMLCITLSIVWSVDGALTSKRVLTFIANTLIAVYLVLDRDFKWLLGVLSWCMLILLLGSALTVLLLPELGMIPDEQGGGRGVNGLFVHKNPLGEAIVLSLIIFFAAFRTRAVAPLISVGGFVIALLLLLPAGSAASLAVAILVLMIQAWFSISRLPLRQRLVLLAFASALGLLVLGAIILNLEAVLAAFGRDATLTGRTDIWAYAWQMSEKRPLLGYGYGIFWEVDAYAQYIKDTFKWSIASAHNGYLDIMLGLGWLGLALAVAFMGTMAFRLIARSRDLEPGVLVFALPTLVYTIAFNLLEAKMFNPRGLGWLVVVIAFLLLTPRLRAIRVVGR